MLCERCAHRRLRGVCCCWLFTLNFLTFGREKNKNFDGQARRASEIAAVNTADRRRAAGADPAWEAVRSSGLQHKLKCGSFFVCTFYRLLGASLLFCYRLMQFNLCLHLTLILCPFKIFILTSCRIGLKEKRVRFPFFFLLPCRRHQYFRPLTRCASPCVVNREIDRHLNEDHSELVNGVSGASNSSRKSVQFTLDDGLARQPAEAPPRSTNERAWVCLCLFLRHSYLALVSSHTVL